MTALDSAPTLEALSDPAPPPGPHDWNDQGVVYLPGLLPDDLIAAYQDEWALANGYNGLKAPPEGEGQWSSDPTSDPSSLWVLDAASPGGWNETCPYMRYPALRRLCTHPPLAAELERLTGHPMGVHLNLTGWVSTTRNWHQDGYLNPAGVGDMYAAVWMALDDVHPDSGVFQYVPGSHRWHTLTYEKIARVVDTSDPMWPTHTETVLTPLVEDEITWRGAEVVSYAPQKGDVLIWHSRLYHRGSVASVPNAYRPALIAHYSSIHHRPDFPPAVTESDGRVAGQGWYFPILTGQPVA